MENTRYFISKLSSVILSISLVILMVAMTCTGIAFAKVMANPKVSYYLRGDVDMDGEVHAADARLALRGSIKLEDYAPGSPEFLRADFNGDGDLTAGDARAILRVSIGLTPDHGKIYNPELDDYYTLHPDDPDKPTTPDEPTDPDEPDDLNYPYAKSSISRARIGFVYYGENAYVHLTDFIYPEDSYTEPDIPEGAVFYGWFTDSEIIKGYMAAGYFFPKEYHRVFDIDEIPYGAEFLYYDENGRASIENRIYDGEPELPSGDPIPTSKYGPDDPYYRPGEDYDPNRAGMYYYCLPTLEWVRFDYEDIPEGGEYKWYDEQGYLIPGIETKPYSPGNEPTQQDFMHCKHCGKSTVAQDGHVYACATGGCSRWQIDLNCPECGVFVPAHTCHTCGN